jgi:hypothetical protein
MLVMYWSPLALLIVLDVAMIALLAVVPCECELSALVGLNRDRTLFIVWLGKGWER